jgi:hypothetical protein
LSDQQKNEIRLLEQKLIQIMNHASKLYWLEIFFLRLAWLV